MKSFLSNDYVLLTSRLILGIVFIVAAVDKIYYPEPFAANIEAYRLVPTFLVNIFALLVPWLELVCGVFLIGGVYIRGSAAILSWLLGIFIIAMATALIRGLEIDCGCFGKEHATPVSWWKVLEDVGLLALGVHLYWCGGKEKAIIPTPIQETP